jgi:hypothetical protein
VSGRIARVIPLAAIAVVVGCSGDSDEASKITADGVSIEVPPGWDGRIASRTWPLAGAVIVQLASFELPEGDDPDGSRARNAMGVGDVVVELAEGLREADVPYQGAGSTRTSGCSPSAASSSSIGSSSSAAARSRSTSPSASGVPRRR